MAEEQGKEEEKFDFTGEGKDYYDVSAYHSRGIAYRKLGQDAKADADEAKACSLDSGFCFIVGRR